jgi:hypothetical protein
MLEVLIKLNKSAEKNNERHFFRDPPQPILLQFISESGFCNFSAFYFQSIGQRAAMTSRAHQRQQK